MPVELPRNTFGYDPATGPVNATVTAPDDTSDTNDTDVPVVLARAAARAADPDRDPDVPCRP
ncbi:hypothetical protein ACFXPI_25295 [Streptomyces sp. NPDC059104]|uniref:hypothetical protein n=1 Tax=Streptomyces sp. NPDC059104 TaxID=3346729 RepID=UPI0036C89D4C